MSLSLTKVIKLEKSFAESVHNIYANAARFCWSSDDLNKYIREGIWENETYRKLPRYAKSFVEGVRHHCDQLHWKLVEFSYVVNGKRLTIDSEEYRAVKPQYVSEKCSHTGAFVYKANPAKLFTQPTK